MDLSTQQTDRRTNMAKKINLAAIGIAIPAATAMAYPANPEGAFFYAALATAIGIVGVRTLTRVGGKRRN